MSTFAETKLKDSSRNSSIVEIADIAVSGQVVDVKLHLKHLVVLRGKY